MYKKRDGTSGIRGQLYETKLISLIHFRTKFDDTIKDYSLATNVADIGTFDDICIRAKLKSKRGTKPVAVFIQAKHREGDKVQLTLNSKNDLAKWFSSYSSIRRLFKPSNEDVLFKGKFEDIECLFVMYTTAKSDLNTIEFKGDVADKLNRLIGTGDKGLHPSHKEEDIVFLCEIIMKEQLVALAVQMAKFLSENNNDKDNNAPIMSMNDDVLLLYHVILTQNVLDVSEIKHRGEEEEHRVASFNENFFNNNDEFLLLFKETMYIEMLKKRKLKEVELDSLLSELFVKPSGVKVLSRLIGNVVTFNDKKLKLEFVNKSMSEDLKRRLEKVDVLQSTVHEAIEIAAKEMLTSRQFKVPTAFGNKDLTIRGKEDNVAPSVYITSVVDKLKNQFVELTSSSAPESIINIDESLGKEFLQLNAGLASTIGNILVSDVNTKYLKFTDTSELLGELAKRLYDEVRSEIPNVHEYRFQIKINTFPKVTFDCDDDEDPGMLNDQVTVLAEYIGDFVCKEEDSIMAMNDIVLRYHVLMLKAVEVSEIQSLNEDDEHRLGSFRQDLFESDDGFVVLFKQALCKKILKLKSLNENEIDLAKEILTSRQFKVPAAFGNKDITIKIKKSKTERRLDHLCLKISQLIAKTKADKIVTLDESLGDGLLKLYGGLAGIVGNILVSEENTKLMKFTDNWESLEDLSKRLYVKLKSRIENLHEYKFDVKVKKFPKLSFRRDEDDENLAKDFLKKLLFFTNQADEKGVETLLKDEIEYHQCLNVNNVRVTADAIFLQYHDAIQRWWMLKEAEYLTKKSDYYEKALALIVDKPLMTSISTTYMIKIKNNIDYTFNEKALNLKVLDQPPGTIFITDSSVLTVAKMVQSLKKIDHFVFDLEYILDLQAKDFIAVSTELSKTNENKVIIVVCNDIKTNWFERLKDLSKALDKKRIIFVVKQTLLETIKCHFVQANNIMTDEEYSLVQMSEETQDAVLQNAKVTFQDVELTLNSIIDEESKAFIKGEVLNKIMNNEPIILGESNTNLNYENLKHLYIDRRVIRVDNLRNKSRYPIDGFLRTLNDIPNVALITAKPGMGKSTLLTHLSLKTKELNPKVWIITVNLLTHSKKFSKWRDNGTNIDYLETLYFFCELLSEKQNETNDLSFELEIVDGNVSLKSCTGDHRTAFELKMFLDYYNRKEIIFLFDDFDEICPMYTDEVLTLLKVVRSYPRKHRMVITGRSYYRVISTLEKTFEESYEIQHISKNQQDEFLLKFWKSKIKLRELSKEQYDNLCSFIEFMNRHYNRLDNNNQDEKVKHEKDQILFLKVCVNFLIHYLKKEIKVCPDFVIQTFNKCFTDCSSININFMEDFDTPLHLYLIADYFQNQIKGENIIPNCWNLEINAFTVYEAFIESNLKKKRFQEGNKIDLNNPDSMIFYENERAEFFAKHYKLGAYVVFYQDADKIFSIIELREIKEIIDKIREGTEKTGLIHSVANGIPNFIHMTFTEYFAVQYICNLLKTETRENKQKSIWDFILNVVFLKCSENVRDILGYKIKTDKYLKAAVRQHQEIIFDLILEQGKGVYTYYPDDFSKYLYLKVRTLFLPAMDDELSNFVRILYELKDTLTKKYIEDPTKPKQIPLIRSYKTLRMRHIKFLFLIEKKRKLCNFGNNSSELEGANNDSTLIPGIDKDAGVDHGPSLPLSPDN